MIRKPMLYQEALQYLVDKTSLPGDWNSRMWAAQEADFRDRAFYISQCTNAQVVDQIHGWIFDFVAQSTEEVTNQDGVKSMALKVGSRTQFADKVRKLMIETGMAKASEFKDVNQNDVTDIRSMARMNLIFDVNTRQAFGFGRWKQGMQPAVLKAFPAARLERELGVAVPRPRHEANLGEVRLKTDPWWSTYINSADIGGFQVQWGPYGFNSGCNQSEVSRREAEKQGLAVPEKPPLDESRVTDGVTATVRAMDPDIKKRLLEKFRKDNGIPSDPREAARSAAVNARRDALQRRLEDAEKSGATDLAGKIQQQLSELPKHGFSVIDHGDSLELKK